MQEQFDQTGTDNLRAAKVMEATSLNDRFSIGRIAHGPELSAALEQQQLQKFFSELAFLYRDIYAKEPWNEYLVCAKSDCRGKTGLPETASVSDEDRKVASSPDGSMCPSCNSPMELFYDQQRLVENLNSLFRQKVFASLLIADEKKLSGFSLGWETSVREGYRDKVVAGTGDQAAPAMSYPEYLEEFRRILGSDFDEESTVFNSAEWAVSSEARSSKASLPLIHAIYALAQEKIPKTFGRDIPVIGHTLVGSKALGIFRKIGFTPGAKRKGSDEVRVYSTLPALIKGTQHSL